MGPLTLLGTEDALTRVLFGDAFWDAGDSVPVLEQAARELEEYLNGRGARASACGTAREGVERVLAAAGPEDVVCACGSLYMIGEVRHLLGLC